MPTPTSLRRSITTRYEGRCAGCAVALPSGSVAAHDRGSRQLYCPACAGPTALAEQARLDPGVPGASALREYERRKAKDEAHVRERFGRLGGLAVALSAERQTTRAWRVGAEGEAKLAASLAGYPTFRMLNDRRVRRTRGNIDHLVISPAGVFVVDAKDYRGRISVRDKGRLLRPDLRLYVGGRDCSRLADGLQWQVKAVESALANSRVRIVPPVTAVLCFVDGEWPILSRPSEFRGVRLEGPGSLRKLLSATAVLDMETVDRLTADLATAFPPK